MSDWGEPKDPSRNEEAARISREYGLEPYFLYDGRMGIHFMHLSASVDYKLTLESSIAPFYFDDDGHSVDEEERAELLELRAVLSRIVRKIDEKLASGDAALAPTDAVTASPTLLRGCAGCARSAPRQTGRC